ncbi:MAG: hypothetical protein ACPGTO_00530 [Polaribacter sp.]
MQVYTLLHSSQAYVFVPGINLVIDFLLILWFDVDLHLGHAVIFNKI